MFGAGPEIPPRFLMRRVQWSIQTPDGWDESLSLFSVPFGSHMYCTYTAMLASPRCVIIYELNLDTRLQSLEMF